MATITIRQLIRAGACSEQGAKFRLLFGTSVEVTEELAIQHAKTFSWDWAADNLLPEGAREDYEQAKAAAWEDYEQATAPALEDYMRAKVAALEDYMRAKAAAGAAYEQAKVAAGAAYEQAKVAAGAAYEQAKAPALEDYMRAKARAFARLYIQHCSTERAA